LLKGEQAMESVNRDYQAVEIDELGQEYEDWLDWVAGKEPLSHETKIKRQVPVPERHSDAS